MFVHNFDPVLLSIGPINIHWYGLVYVLGFLAFYFVAKKQLNLSSKEVDSLTVWLVIGMLIGARTFHFLFYRPDLFSITEFFALWNGGMSFHGALLGLGISAGWWAKRNRKDFWRIADTGALVAAFFLALGRIANFINAEIVGTRTDAWWCVQFPTADGCRHPVQLYAAVKDVVIGFALLWFSNKEHKPGFIFWSFTVLYAVLRFLVNFLRDDPILAFGWLKMGHILSLTLLIVGGYMLITRHKSDLAKIFK